MAKYDDQLARMNYLMEFKNQPKEVRSNIEYHANGADGKVYGILKEGTKYYIKVTESGKENLAESYEYINGFVNRRENEFKSYNDATKHLELKLMSLNEAYGKKGDVSTVDLHRNDKAFTNLTEEARKELDRMNQIFENSCKIGKDCCCDPESKGSASPENTTKNNDPFKEKVTPDMDYKGSNGTVEGATDNKEVKGVDEDLQSDKMKSANSGSEKDMKDANDDLDGESVADKKPKGGKAVMVNEGIFEGEPEFGGENLEEPQPIDNLDVNVNDDADNVDINADLSAEDFSEEEPADNADITDDFANLDINNDEALVGDPDSEDDLDVMLEEFLNSQNVEEEQPMNEGEDAITGPDKVLDKEGNSINGTNNGVDGETGEEWKRIEEAQGGNVNDPAKQGDEETMKSYQAKGNLPAQSWDKMKINESKLNALVESITSQLISGAKKKETLEEKITRIVKEEVTKLDVWGKHPKYGKEPMTHPEAKEVLAGTADRDFNDDSAKGSEQYGKKIGDGKPFDQETIDNLTDQVLAKIKGALK